MEDGYVVPSRRDVCARCNKIVQRSHTSADEIVCRSCRGPRRSDYRKPCVDCGTPSYGERCRTCRDKAQAMYPDDVRRRRRELNRRRAAREQQAPGLNSWERRQLRRLWMQQGKRCVYCQDVATQVDHVVPLALGGTNYEGNLAPTCKACNQAKGDNLVIEWRAGKKARHMRWVPPEPKPRVRKPKVYIDMPLIICRVCLTMCPPRNSRSRTCSSECSLEANARDIRSRHRAKRGLPDDWNVPVQSRAG